MPPVEKPIVFFDGACGLCNAFVDGILRADRAQVFLFAPLQGETAKKLLPPQSEDPKAWSVILVDEDGTHRESEATLRVLKRLGGIYGVFGFALILPRVLRDPIYRVVAANRYRWFGKKDACRMPTAEERTRFLP